ncbi:hypothetical protein V498_04142 [Pseudogymnoascus sp. VKM F-4517 (FW-2822)]|nr:hypothetical protein V498_04142 [Pseudogymnoascus sp. VKM F-4517 (FW-2822)]
MKIQQRLVAAAALVSPTLAALATFSPITGINYAVGIPSSTSTSSTNLGDIFISVSFPAKYQYVGIGIGTQMAGSTIFAVYTDGNGNVTVSPRDGAGHFEPQHSSSKSVTILDGSKADANTVVANFKYRATESQLDVQSTASPFIGAWKEGAAFDTTNLEQALDHHDGKRIYTLNLAQANVWISSNPFLGASTVQSPGQGSQGGSDLFNNTHTIFGASIFGLILVQPFLGIIHHFLYRREGKGTLFGLAHCWYGRAIMILAVVNGGLGLELAGNSRGGEIAYGVVAGVALLVYLGAAAYSVKKPQEKVRDKDELRGGASRAV